MKSKVNEIRVSYQERIKSPSWHQIKSSKDAARLLYEHWDIDNIGLQESFKVVLLNNNNKVKGIYLLSKGGITGTVVDLRIFFAVVSKSLSAASILAHTSPQREPQGKRVG